MIQPKKKGKGVSVMVWGAFYGVGEQSNLLRLGRDPDAKEERLYRCIISWSSGRPAAISLGTRSFLYAGQLSNPYKSFSARMFCRVWHRCAGMATLFTRSQPHRTPVVFRKLVYEVRPDIKKKKKKKRWQCRTYPGSSIRSFKSGMGRHRRGCSMEYGKAVKSYYRSGGLEYQIPVLKPGLEVGVYRHNN